MAEFNEKEVVPKVVDREQPELHTYLGSISLGQEGLYFGVIERLKHDPRAQGVSIEFPAPMSGMKHSEEGREQEVSEPELRIIFQERVAGAYNAQFLKIFDEALKKEADKKGERVQKLDELLEAKMSAARKKGHLLHKLRRRSQGR